MDDKFQVLDFFVDHACGVDNGGKANNSSSVLIIMENWDWHELFQGSFNFETVRTLNILKINTTERWSKMLHNINEFIGVLAVDAQVDGLNTGKLVEENCFAFHNGLGGKATKVSKAKNGRTI